VDGHKLSKVGEHVLNQRSQETHPVDVRDMMLQPMTKATRPSGAERFPGNVRHESCETTGQSLKRETTDLQNNAEVKNVSGK
jgi:hypothetical protein